jgi:peptidoglycan/LPS O-acetylase OafA/YrhL
MVVGCHAAKARHPGAAPLGEEGVAIFFALSGLLICHRLLAEFAAAGRIDLVGFYVRRAFRILPPALAFLAVLAVFAGAGLSVVAPGELTSCLLLWRNYFVGGGWYAGHFWSLAVEEHFYLIFPILLAWLGPRRALIVTAGLAAALLGWRVLALHSPWLFEHTHAVSEYYRTDCRLPDLLLGALAASTAARAADRLVLVAGAAGGAALVARLAGHPAPWAAESILLPWMLLATVLRPATRIGRLLEWRPLTWLGGMSYSLYLWQQLFFCGPARFRLPALAPLQDWPWNVAALLSCAAASHYLLEQPLTRLGRRLAAGRRASPPQEPHVEAYRIRLDDRRFGRRTRPTVAAERAPTVEPSARPAPRRTA